MAYDAFLKLDGLKGEGTHAEHKDEIELQSFSWGGSNPTTVGSHAGGMSAGKVMLSSFNITKATDKASPTLFQNMCTGKHFTKATVTLNKAAGDAKGKPLAFLKYDFENVFVESLQWAGGHGDNEPTEAVSFAYGKVTITYTPQTEKGTAGGPTSASWDQTKVST